MIRRLAINTFSNVGTLLLKLAITFIMTPLLVLNLGRYDYGIWEMICAIIGYMGILDLGIRPAVSRFASQYIAMDNKVLLSQLYATAWFYLLAVGMLIGIFMVCWGIFFPEILAENSNETQRYTLLLIILGAQLMFVFPAYTVESYMEAYQEYYLKNNITIINSIIGSVLIFNLITPDNALVLLAGVNAAGISLKYIAYIIYMQRKRTFLRVRFHYFSVVKLKELFRFSVKTAIQGISTRIENATDSLVIGAILGPAMVPIYSIPANLTNYIRLITYNLTHVFMPYFSALAVSHEPSKIVRIYLFGSKLTIGCVMIMTVGAIGLGAPFLELWIGGEIAASAGPIILILIAFTVLPLFNPYSSRYLTAIDRHGVLAKWSPLAAIANLVLSLILIYPLGIFGVALGSLIPALIFQPLLLAYCCKHLEITVISYIRAAIVPMMIPTILMGAVMLYARLNFVIDSYGTVIFIALVSSALFCIAAFFLALSSQERQQLYNIARKH